MKLIHLATSLFGGAGKAAFRIHNALRSIGVDSKVITLSAPDEFLDDPHVIVLNRNPALRGYSSLLTRTQAAVVQSGPNLTTPISLNVLNLSEHGIYKADVINIHNTYNLINYRFLENSPDKQKIVLTLHDQRAFTGACHHSYDCQQFIDSSCSSCPQVRKPFRRIVHNNYLRYSAALSKINRIEVVAPSLWLTNLAQRSMALKNASHHVIRNPASSEFLEPKESQKTDEMRLRIGFAAAYFDNPFKGLDVLSRSLHAIGNSDWFEKTEFVFIGSGNIGNLPNTLRYSTINAKSESEMRKVLQSLHLLVIPSVQDNFPNLISEALLSGCELITSDSGGLAELADDLGYKTFPSGDSSTLADLLVTFKPDFTHQQRRIETARKVFSPTSIAHSYLQVYKD